MVTSYYLCTYTSIIMDLFVNISRIKLLHNDETSKLIKEKEEELEAVQKRSVKIEGLAMH